MNGKYRSYHSSIAFLDLFLNALLGFVFLFLISWLLINPIAKNKIIDATGEFIITVTWDKNSQDDVDTWILDPNNDAMYFGNKETRIMHLDRDDLGLINDTIYNSDGSSSVIQINKELVTIRGIVPGEYIINLHMYSKRDPTPTTVTIEITKINPFKIILAKDVILKDMDQELTVARITVNSQGEITDINYLPRTIVYEYKGTSSPSLQ